MKRAAWLRFVPMGVGMAVGGGIINQSEWSSRVLQILVGSAVAGLVALVVFFALAWFFKPKKGETQP